MSSLVWYFNSNLVLITNKSFMNRMYFYEFRSWTRTTVSKIGKKQNCVFFGFFVLFYLALYFGRQEIYSDGMAYIIGNGKNKACVTRNKRL